mgnify:CR=1 FL=1
MKQAYISTHLADAQSAGDRFHLNPIILLAQAALESGWGTSRLAREANNHFASLATGRATPSGTGAASPPDTSGASCCSAATTRHATPTSTSPASSSAPTRRPPP